ASGPSSAAAVGRTAPTARPRARLVIVAPVTASSAASSPASRPSRAAGELAALDAVSGATITSQAISRHLGAVLQTPAAVLGPEAESMAEGCDS
ncbi:MAG: FMN-binding protein, partial [Pseudomonadota bacterium]